MNNLRQKPIAVALIAALSLSGCAVEKEAVKMQSDTMQRINEARAKEPPPAPVITTTSGAWLMGQTIKVAPPVSPILSSAILYHPAQRVSLADIAAYITLSKGLVIDVSEVTQTQTGTTPGISTTMPASPMGASPMGSPAMLPSPQQLGIGGGFGMAMPQTIQSMSINYEGTVSGLLDIAANKAAVWWKFVDGKVVFFRTETKTFYLPSVARKSVGNSTITTTSSGSGSASSSGATSTSTTSGATITSDYSIDVWGDMEKTAKAVGNGAQVVANASAGSLTVTGTPSQIRAISDWVKTLNEQLSQQVAITVHVYRVKMTNEDTYNWDPSIVFKKAAGTYGYTLTSPTALVPASGATPLGLVANVLTGAPGAWGQYSGSQAAFQALSTLGNVSETLQRTMVTLNGQPAPIQIANQQGYLASSTTTQATTGGSTTAYTPGSVTTGFTATFLPRVINGKIVLSMTMTNSSLIGITSVGNSTNGIQVTNVDLDTFQQSVSLTPGDALLLSGVQQDNSNTSNSGVGSAKNMLFGGGVNNKTGKSMIAIVVSAKVL